MATNRDFGRSPLLNEQYQREMELIAVALQEESQEEREERLSLVSHAWALTSTCFRSQVETGDVPASNPVAFVHS
ncbi:MAG TPA: hypothetical protein VL461_11950 [Dictyobacter sp.]|jgi:hypothetical protein|nr:hypothetical protein [Dictyobacter sp.]